MHTHSQEESVGEKRPITEQSDTETETGGEAGPSQSQNKKRHITNIYLTDPDEEAIVDSEQDHKELYDKEGLFLEAVRQQSQAVCQGVQDLVRLAKDTLWQAGAIKIWTSPEEGDRMSELDTGQVWIPEVTHQTQGTQQIIRLQVPGPRSQYFSYYST